MFRIIISCMIFLVPFTSKAVQCCDEIEVSHEIIAEDCCVEIKVYNPLCDDTFASFYQKVDGTYEEMGEVSINTGDTTKFTLCPVGTDDFVDYEVFIKDEYGNPRCGNSWFEGSTKFSGSVDLSSCCNCPENRDGWFDMMITTDGPCPDSSCYLMLNLDLPEDAGCYKYYYYENDSTGYISNAQKIGVDKIDKFNECIPFGATRKINIYLMQDTSIFEYCMLTDSITCDTSDCDCDKPEPCTPDCEETSTDWEPLENKTFNSSICSGCEISAEYTSRLACPQQYQDLQITNLELSTPGCDNCDIADLYGEAMRAIIQENIMNFEPQGVGDCSTIWRIGMGGCWSKSKIYVFEPGQPLDSSVTWYQCDSSDCCYQSYEVCRDSSGGITATATGDPTIVDCENKTHWFDPCEAKCNWLQSVEGYFGADGGSGTHGKQGGLYHNLDQKYTVGLNIKKMNNALYFEFKSGMGNDGKIKLYDLEGNILDSKSFNINSKNHIEELRLNGYNTGVFLYSIEIEGRQIKSGKVSIVK